MKNSGQIGLKLVSLEEISIVLSNANKITNAEAFENCGFNIEIHLIIEKSKSSVGIRMDFTLHFKEGEVKNRLLNSKSLPEFKYSGAATFQTIGLELDFGIDKTINIPKNIMHRMTDVAYSTFRGMIFTKTFGTGLQGSMLPIIGEEQIIQMIGQKPSGNK